MTTRAPLIQVEQTPNPDALRLLPGIRWLSGPPVEIAPGDASAKAPLAAVLLAIDGIDRIMIGPDFVTAIRRSATFPWSGLKPQLLAGLADFLFSGEPALPGSLLPEPLPPAEGGLVAEQIVNVIERHVRPMLARDGGEATLLRFDAASGIAYVRMGGACGGCPSGKTTLKQGIEQAIKRYVPEVVRVEAATDEAGPSADSRARVRSWIAARWPRFNPAAGRSSPS
ncbi:MAG: NifU family protein [Proteobacteria bacterium]|nr:NifU family protein [Pseudomonadota bacterium]